MTLGTKTMGKRGKEKNEGESYTNVSNQLVKYKIIPLLSYLKTKRSKCSVVSTRASNSTTEKMRSMCQEVCCHECPIGMSPNSNFIWMGHLNKGNIRLLLSQKFTLKRYANKIQMEKNKAAYSTLDNFLNCSLCTRNQLLYIPGQGISDIDPETLCCIVSFVKLSNS